jgi:hypothetical protein
MKKVLFVLVLMMAALVVNAQGTVVRPPTPPTPPPPPGYTPINPYIKYILILFRVADLPKPITDSIDKDNVGTTIKEDQTKKADLPKLLDALSNSQANLSNVKLWPFKEGDRTAVTAAELPKPITDNIAKDFAGCTIKDATKVVKDKVVTYEVVVAGTTNGTLVYEEVVTNPAQKK